MTQTNRLVTVSLVALWIAVLPVRAAEQSTVHSEGFQCEIALSDDSSSGGPELIGVYCQISDEAGPVPTDVAQGIESRRLRALDPLLQLLSTLDHALQLQLAQSPRHGLLDTPKPTP